MSDPISFSFTMTAPPELSDTLVVWIDGVKHVLTGATRADIQPQLNAMMPGKITLLPPIREPSAPPAQGERFAAYWGRRAHLCAHYDAKTMIATAVCGHQVWLSDMRITTKARICQGCEHPVARDPDSLSARKRKLKREMSIEDKSRERTRRLADAWWRALGLP